ncbi:aminotransferase class I/II-fold pyridoxal phosphate-dependent enzyme [Treponema pedis]|uniref:aminotransferase class I/II-fold pyridoxal phosphate-dependent enzyme n=1 Tax=Treponema pedis TaxID=409322 RepID=UPI0004940BD8|nr:aminotransferase class I/II-fold pyridoxal phosphate-dependent enzyme [Treponema pedis]
MQAIILAAGMGKRLRSYTKGATKCMVSVNGKTLIEYTIEALVLNKIKRLVIVIGYKGNVLKDFISSKFNEKNLNGMEIKYIENPIYDKTNNIYSLYLACNEMSKDDTLLLESDLIFKPSIITKLIESKDRDLAVVSPFEPWMDGTCTLLDENNYIISILDKAHFNWQDTGSYFKTVNIYKFSKEFTSQYYIPFLEAYQKAFGKNEYYEQVLKALSFLSASVLKGLVVNGDDWYEIDDPADLAIAEDRFKTGKEKLYNLQKRFGGYWRFPQLKDFCYLVNPYFPPENLVHEMTASFKTLLTEYPSGAYQQSLLAAKIFNVSPEHIIVGNGAAELISSLAKQITGKVAVPFPTFNEYPERLTNAEIIPIRTSKEDFRYTLYDIMECVNKENPGTVILINPDNPSGNFLGKDEVLKLCGFLREKNIMLIFDESFIDFAEKEKRYSLIDEKILADYTNLAVIKSISKSYGVPGLRLGVLACADCGYVNKIKKENSIWNINSFGEYFLQIYDKYGKTYHAACDSIAYERKRFIKELSAIKGISVFPSEANYVLCKLDDGVCPETLAVYLLEKYGIFIKDLSSKKGFEHGNYIRLAVRDEKDNNYIVGALKEVLPELNKA